MQNWGGYLRARHRSEKPIFWRDQVQFSDSAATLAVGLGRSYGDVCLNGAGDLLLMPSLDRILHFDPESGVVTCEAGVSLAALLAFCVPRGWFAPVTPGTKHVTIGGAIANDVHGKNHHVAGSLGNHVESFELVRSDGTYFCSRERNPSLFEATLGGFGLTGVITWAQLRLHPIRSAAMEVRSTPFRGIDEFVALSAVAEERSKYVVAWLDSTDPDQRGILLEGVHSPEQGGASYQPKVLGSVPSWWSTRVVNNWTGRLLNAGYSRRNAAERTYRQTLDGFFYPLDCVAGWNRLYGRSGLVQFQCVVPRRSIEAAGELMNRAAKSGAASFLTVAKLFGTIRSAGIMSFPRPGITVSFDFPASRRSLALLKELEAITMEAGGALYPAKDSTMSPESFRASYPRIEEFRRYVDPSVSSSFWRRVAGE